MRCEDVQAHIPDYLNGGLPPATRDAVTAHVRTCAACAAEYEAAEDTWQRLGVVGVPAADSGAMRAHFMAALDEYQHTVGDRARRTHHWLPYAAAAAMLVVGVAVGRLSVAPPSQEPQIAEMRAELREMRQMVTLSLLQQQSASERLKGVTWTQGIDEPGVEITGALLDALMHDPNVNVRLASIDALRRFADREAVRRGAMEALPRQTSPIVQIALIDFVVDVNGREAADALRRLSMDAMLDEAVRTRATQRLEQLG